MKSCGRKLRMQLKSMKKNIVKRREIVIGILCFALGIVVMFFASREQVQYQKKITVKILKNSVGSMEAFQELSNSCRDAYKTVTTCISDVKSCNFETETKKLDEYNKRRQHADTQIDWMNKDMEEIIKQVKANQ